MKSVWPIAVALLATTACSDQNSTAAAAESEADRLLEPRQVRQQDLRAAVSDERVRTFYEQRDWQPAWTKDTAPGLLEELRGASRHGLDAVSYTGAIEAAGTPAAREAALTKAALDLADALVDGKSDPTKIFEIYTLPRPSQDVVAGLSQAVANDGAGEWLKSLAPRDGEYRALSEAYVRYARQVGSRKAQEIESGDLIREGDSDPRVPRIAEALRTNGYLAEVGATPGAQDSGQSSRYTAEMAAAVERMQEDYGVAADSVVGPDTLELLNTGPEERARTLAVNLERRRWLERDPPKTRIDVNTAAAVLDYYRDGQLRDRRNVVVGQPGWETPQLGSPIFRLVANPTWTVPKSIEEDEIAGRGEAYLRRNNMVRRDGWIVQQPGPDNALGQVKFDMQNEHAIYLHDTPAKHLFSRNQRHFSHGCVRVDNAEEFARMLAREGGVPDEYQQAKMSGDETFVALQEKIPVRLIYQTAFVGPGGKVTFRTDPYGWDERVAEALGYSARQARQLRTHVTDIGP